MSIILGKAIEIATREHKLQKRWGGQPYITHPLAVMKIAAERNKSLITTLSANDLYEDLQIVAVSHDLDEDQKYSPITLCEELSAVGLNSLERQVRIQAALYRLNKNHYSSYLEFTLAAKEDFLAREVKLADITHNLIDLKKGSMKEKYELVLYILNN